jgi:tetratricopeptide (TPR) repeat protein
MDAPVSAYLAAAERMHRERAQAKSLAVEVGWQAQQAECFEVAARLPQLNEALWQALTTQAEQVSHRLPRLGWILAALIEAAARHSADLRLQALAAWQAGRAANRWARPDLAAQAAEQARRIFAQLGKNGWLAACDWVEFALPWAKPDYLEAIARLQAALTGLEQAGFSELLPHCLASLAFAQVVRSDFIQAAENLARCERLARQTGDAYALIDCALYRAGLERRKGLLPQAIASLHSALDLCKRLPTPVEQARAHFALGICYLGTAQDQARAQEYLWSACNTFVALEMPLWEALCYVNLAEAYACVGSLEKSGPLLEKAGQIYARFDSPGPQADILHDLGYWHSLRGEYTRALECFKSAERLHARVGSQLCVAIDAMQQALMHQELGRYQQALHLFEQAAEQFTRLEAPAWQAECDMYLGKSWLLLSHPERALPYLTRSIELSRPIAAYNYCIIAYGYLATMCRELGDYQAALRWAEEGLELAQKLQLGPPTAFLLHKKGDLLGLLGQTSLGLACLQEAASRFAAMEMGYDLAEVYQSLGVFYTRQGQPEAARQAWEQALNILPCQAPQIEWQVQSRLAELAESAGDPLVALQRYRQSIAALSRQRRSLLQPAIANPYLARSTSTFDRAVALAIALDSPLQALKFIEESKAQVVTRHLEAGQGLAAGKAQAASQLSGLAAEIRWLQAQTLGFSKAASPLRGLADPSLQQQITKKVREYDDIFDRLARGAGLEYDIDTPQALTEFELARFRAQARNACGPDWLALDYYWSEQHLALTIVTAEECRACRLPISGAARFAVEICSSVRQSRQLPDETDLLSLGQLLFPADVCARLGAETTVLIVPHRRLHNLPWAALPVGGQARPLAKLSLPVVVPSLQSLLALWQRPPASRPRPTGLVLALSEFPGRYPPLPYARAEAAGLQQLLGASARFLLETRASWQNLQAEQQGTGLAHYSFLHIASHAFHDAVTGRLSRFALSDQDVWLDQLWELAPLPELVSFSACNGTQSLVYAGDEHVGLAVTCLAAGANSVIGSLWPVQDTAAAGLMLDFYRNYLAGEGIARSLALAQRAAARAGGDPSAKHAGLDQWGSFLCVGCP